ncbi:MAG: NUDIX hydrolase, partial [Candidatus Micrarchaeota archaeon]
ACDSILIEERKILLIKRAKEPFKGMWALPGGRIEENETAEECLVREMKEETGLDVEPMKLVGVYSDPARDPRLIIAAAYLVRRTGGKEMAGDDAGETGWFPLNKMPPLCSDHGKMVADALRNP